jgi:Immune inhibitor A-like, MAM domain
MRRGALLGLLGIVGLIALTVSGAGLAAKPVPNSVNAADDTYDVTAKLNSQTLPVLTDEVSNASRGGFSSFAAAADPVVGEERNWVALDDTFGFFYRKGYTLRGIGNNIEVWVASELNRRAPASTALPQIGQSSGINFLDGDCRNGVRTVITDAQVAMLVNAFDTNILPKESEAFSVAPARDGSHAQLGPPTFNPAGDGSKTVVLVDNVRDDNFYDLNNTQGFSYIAGFFSSQVNNFFDRNVMTIDAFDWLHRTGENPPHEPVPGNNCTSAPARPFLYEGVFAHEYQHLLEHYEDGDEENWVNEGLSDWAQTLTGYVDPSTPITEIGFDSHTQCFLGYLGVQTPANPNPRAGGPENSLTRWSDQGDGEILCDYGAAYTMMEFVHGRFGTSFMSALHRGDANGLVGLQEAIDGLNNRKVTAQEIVHDWTLMVAIDGLIDEGAKLAGFTRERKVTAPTLHATINWDTPHAYDTPGAPSNGSDYVRLRDASGNYLHARSIESLSFTGASTLPTRPVQWTVAADPPGHPGNPALYSGAANNRDEAIVREVAVPSGAGAVLTFDARWNEELGWDFGFVQVSTNGGASYTSVACTDTTTETNPDALPTAKANVPGFTGDSGGFRPQTCSLATYAGQTVLLAFRAFNDPSVLGENPAVPPGFWVDNVTVGSTLVSDGSSLAGWRSFTEVRPNTVAGFTVRIVSIRGNRIEVRELPLTSAFEIKGKANARRFLDPNADFVAAIVTYDDPPETSTQYAPYRLTVNGVVQPGGGM